jgi:8-oxo-dGTP diphosphatase
VREVQRVAAYNVCVDEDQRLLLARLSNITEAPGAWTLPGGGIDFGEHPETAAIRELFEETGLRGRIVELAAVDSFERTIRADDGEARYHAIRIIYRTAIESGELAHETAGSTDRAEWFSREELRDLKVVPTATLGMRLAYGEAR